MGGGNLAHQDKKKGFAISGILYPLLILTLFLVVQMLFMLQTRKNILDKARTQLADSVNKSNQVYTNEELSILIQEQTKLVNDQKEQLEKLESKVNQSESVISINKNNIDLIKLENSNRWDGFSVNTYPYSCGADNASMRKMVQDYFPKFISGSFNAHKMNGYGCDYYVYVNKTSDRYGTVILTGYAWNTFALGVNTDNVWNWYYANMTKY